MKQPYDRVMRNWRIWRDEGLQRAAARAGDLVIVVGGACIAALTRFGELHFSEPAWTLVAVVALLAAALFPLFGQYESWRGRSTWQLVFRVALAWSLALACGLLARAVRGLNGADDARPRLAHRPELVISRHLLDDVPPLILLECHA